MHTPGIAGPILDSGKGPESDGDKAPPPPPPHHDDGGGNADSAAAGGSARRNDRSTRQQRGRETTRTWHIPERRALLATLAQLPSLVAKKIISPAEANSMRATIQTLLDELRHEANRAAGTSFDPSAVQDALRDHPDLLQALAPMMSDDQLRQYADEEFDADTGSRDNQSGSQNPRKPL